MAHRSQKAWAVVVIANVFLGGAAGCLPPGPLGVRGTHAALGALGGFILSILGRLAIEWLWHLDLRRVAQVGWLTLQAVATGVGFWAGLTVPNPDMPRPFFVIMETALGFFFGLAITVAWVLLFELLRYRLPALVRRGVQKVHRRHTLRL